jgi:hypothetical protein
MYEQRVSTLESPRVEVTACQGNLEVTTWDNSEVLIEVEREEVLTVEEREDAVALAVNDDCRLTVPAGAFLSILQVQGDLSVQGRSGAVEAANVQGDAKLRGGAGSAALGTVQTDLLVEDWAGAVNAETVKGDARVRQVDGNVNLGAVVGDLGAAGIGGALTALSVGGDVHLRELGGNLSLGDVGGDLSGRNLAAGADVAQVKGDVSLKTVFAGPHAWRVLVAGDVVVKAFPGSDATFTLQAAEGRIRARGFAGQETEGGQWQGVIGGGETRVSFISTHGNVMVKAVTEDEKVAGYADFVHGAPSPSEVPAEELAWRIQQRVAEKLSKIDFEAIAQREAERARRQAERESERARRLAEKARYKAEQVRKKAESKRGVHWRLEWDTERGGRRATKQRQTASEEERVAVLKMLAEGKISAEEAETLLQALES